MLLSILAAACGIGALYTSWRSRIRPKAAVNLAGWALIGASVSLWIRATGVEFGVVIAFLVMPLLAWVVVLANTQVRARKTPRIQPAEAGARSLPEVFRHLALFAVTVPGAALASALLAMAVAQLLPLDVVDRMAFAVLAVPVLWGLLAWWICSDVRPLRPAAGVAVIVASCALFLYGSASAS